MSRVKKSLDYKRIRRLVWLVLTVFVLLGCSLQGVAGSAYYSLMMQVYGMVSSPPVILQNGTAGTSTIYTNNTSAKISVEALNWLSGWDKRVKITINSTDVDEALTDFPVLVYLSSSSGENNDDVTSVFDEVGSDYNATAYTTSDGTTRLYFEVEYWNATSEKAWVWAKVPSISNTTDTDIYIYYDSAKDGSAYNSPTNVWDSNFKMVQHLHETSGIHYDSTSNNWDSTSITVTQQGADIGKIDGADEFNGTSDYVAIGDLDQTSDFAVEFWMKADNITGSWRSVFMKNSDYGFEFNSAGVLWARVNDGTWTATTGTSYDGIVVGQYYHVVMVWDEINNDLYFYVNATLVNSDLTMGNHVANDLDLLFGSWNGGSEYFDGIVDEVRISNTTRSTGWIKASYESERDDLLDFGSEERNIIDYVDINTSNVDFSDDKGTHSNFSAQQVGPDSSFDILTEEDTLGSWGNYSSELLINPGAEFGNTTGWTATGPNAANFDAGNDCPSGSAGPHTGSNAFYWNSPSSSSDWAYQEVDLSPWLSGIQSGEAQIMAKGWVVCSEYHDPPWDIVRMRVIFYDNSSLEISSDTYDTGERGNLTSWTEFGIENYTIPTNAVKVRVWFQTYENNYDAGNADDFTLKVRTFRNYELDLEVQWTNTNYSEENEELCIYGGTMDAENLRVDVRNGSKWENLFNDLSSGWNNISVSSYLTSSNFTIRFKGGNETVDTAQNSWNIDASLLHVWTTDAMTYDYVLRVNNTVTDSWQIRLKKYADSNISRLQTCTIYFRNSTDGASGQIQIENGNYTLGGDEGSWYDLHDSETIYIAMTAEATSTGTSYVRTYLEILIPNTSTYSQYIITFEIT